MLVPLSAPVSGSNKGLLFKLIGLSPAPAPVSDTSPAPAPVSDTSPSPAPPTNTPYPASASCSSFSASSCASFIFLIAASIHLDTIHSKASSLDLFDSISLSISSLIFLNFLLIFDFSSSSYALFNLSISSLIISLSSLVIFSPSYSLLVIYLFISILAIILIK